MKKLIWIIIIILIILGAWKLYSGNDSSVNSDTEIPEGYHMMPDGTLMKDDAMMEGDHMMEGGKMEEGDSMMEGDEKMMDKEN